MLVEFEIDQEQNICYFVEIMKPSEDLVGALLALIIIFTIIIHAVY